MTSAVGAEDVASSSAALDEAYDMGIPNARRAVAPALGVALAIPILASGQDPLPGWRTDLSRASVPLGEIASGGPPKDGIPSIDQPKFIGVSDADEWLDDREPVILVEVDGRARAYPHQILVWHEIANDELAGVPLAVTYCPLCNTAIAFDRRVAGRTLEFGVSGFLRHSDMVMYDRETESWWQQALGEAIVGELMGARLEIVPSQTVSWATFKRSFPDGMVLSRDTGHRGYEARYGRNPYTGYDSRTSPIEGFFNAEVDDRLPAMEHVAGLAFEGEAVAYPFSRLREDPVVNDTVGGAPVVVFWAPGTASAMDDASIAGGRDIGSTGIFLRTHEGRALEFSGADPGTFVDSETGSIWSVTGEAISGPLAGARLKALPFADFFWFAWAVFQEGTRIGG